jgi:hypothetical protein
MLEFFTWQGIFTTSLFMTMMSQQERYQEMLAHLWEIIRMQYPEI